MIIIQWLDVKVMRNTRNDIAVEVKVIPSICVTRVNFDLRLEIFRAVVIFLVRFSWLFIVKVQFFSYDYLRNKAVLLRQETNYMENNKLKTLKVLVSVRTARLKWS